jgi:hypothetical protein
LGARLWRKYAPAFPDDCRRLAEWARLPKKVQIDQFLPLLVLGKGNNVGSPRPKATFVLVCEARTARTEHVPVWLCAGPGDLTHVRRRPVPQATSHPEPIYCGQRCNAPVVRQGRSGGGEVRWRKARRNRATTPHWRKPLARVISPFRMSCSFAVHAAAVSIRRSVGLITMGAAQSPASERENARTHGAQIGMPA